MNDKYFSWLLFASNPPALFNNAEGVTMKSVHNFQPDPEPVPDMYEDFRLDLEPDPYTHYCTTKH